MTPRPRQTHTTVRAVAYLRVSTEGQAESGLSLEHQQAKCEALAALHDFELLETITDAGESAKSLERPGMARLLALVRSRQIEAVLIAKLDRLTRSVRDLTDLITVCTKHGVALLSAAESLDTSSAGGRMVVKMLATISEWEREVIGERTKDALNALRQRGHVYGRIPYGSRRSADGVTLEAHPDEQRMIARLLELRGAGEAWQAIADTLNAEGYRNRAGRPWILTNTRAAWLTATKHAADRAA
jgi:DNA invertase Pin-like site-specific DNA recombinase